MPIGRPDWYSSGRQANSASLDDMAELAVRLGSGVNYDRTGKLIYIDDFSADNALTVKFCNSAAAGPAIDNTLWETGSGVLTCTINTGATNYLRVNRRSRTWYSSFLSMEAAFRWTNDIDYVQIDLWSTRNEYYARGRVYLLNDGQTIQYYNPSLGLETIAVLDTPVIHTGKFTTMKVDIDTDTGYYVRCRVDSNVIDMSSLQLSTTIASGLPDMINGTVYFLNEATNAPVIHLDRIIVTEDL